MCVCMRAVGTLGEAVVRLHCTSDPGGCPGRRVVAVQQGFEILQPRGSSTCPGGIKVSSSGQILPRVLRGCSDPPLVKSPKQGGPPRAQGVSTANDRGCSPRGGTGGVGRVEAELRSAPHSGARQGKAEPVNPGASVLVCGG